MWRCRPGVLLGVCLVALCCSRVAAQKEAESQQIALPDTPVGSKERLPLEEKKVAGSRSHNGEEMEEAVTEREAGVSEESVWESLEEKPPELNKAQAEYFKEEILEGQELTLAIALLGFVVFIMTLFYLVNWNDEDMRIYAWTVISTTISIFIAIFTFTSVQSLLQETFLPADHPPYSMTRLFLSFVQLCMYFCGVQFSIAFVSGALERHPFHDDEPMHMQYERREIGFKSLSSLFAHMCAFAAINFGGCLQHLEPFNSSVSMRFMVPPLMFASHLFICRMIRIMRLRVMKNIKETHGHSELESIHQLEASAGIDWCLVKWADETYDIENEIAGMSISFLLVNACRFAITGVMPNGLGIEEEGYIHPVDACYKLLGLGAVFATGCVISVLVDETYVGPLKAIDPGSIKAVAKRCILVCQSAGSTAFAWCLLFAAKWEITRAVEAFPPNGVVSRVFLALLVSVSTFFVILGLDWLADHEATSDMVDKAIISIIHALALLVGFSWEQSFEGAVEVLAERCFRSHMVAAEMSLAAAVCIIVYPAWRKYILHKLLKLIDHRDMNRRTSATPALHSDGGATYAELRTAPGDSHDPDVQKPVT